MKILCLSDLHRVIADILAMEEQNRWIASLLSEYSPDVVLITGDIFESDPGVKCINTGNDYHPPFQHYLLEI